MENNKFCNICEKFDSMPMFNVCQRKKELFSHYSCYVKYVIGAKILYPIHFRCIGCFESDKEQFIELMSHLSPSIPNEEIKKVKEFGLARFGIEKDNTDVYIGHYADE